jgi:hypothetical protein
LAISALAPQNPSSLLALLGLTLWAVSILALYALLDFIVLMLTLQWSSLAQMAPSPLAVLTTALTALEVSNATLPGAQFLNVPLATTRSKETWTVILVPLATPVHSKISLKSQFVPRELTVSEIKPPVLLVLRATIVLLQPPQRDTFVLLVHIAWVLKTRAQFVKRGMLALTIPLLWWLLALRDLILFPEALNARSVAQDIFALKVMPLWKFLALTALILLLGQPHVPLAPQVTCAQTQMGLQSCHAIVATTQSKVTWIVTLVLLGMPVLLKLWMWKRSVSWELTAQAIKPPALPVRLDTTALLRLQSP